MYQQAFMRRAIALSRQALDTPGTEPFGAVIVRDGQVVGEGLNHSLAHFDPTSHGETEAIRDACRTLKTVDLSGCDLYSSCEPCAMCVATMVIAGISRLYYAASMAQAGAALGTLSPTQRHPIDVDRLRADAGRPAPAGSIPSEQALDQDATEVLNAWADLRRAGR
jgi:tRNA(Arg) A34 adenosine deaminase TadA